jgi:hypothetical protein
MKIKILNILCRFTFLIYLILSIACSSERKNNNEIFKLLPQEFRINWKIDSIGSNGFREHSYNFDSSAKCWLINGQNIYGYSLGSIISALGKPSTIGRGKEDGDLMVFYVVKQGNRSSIKMIEFAFDKKNKMNMATVNTGN